jgi:arginase
MLQVIGAGVGSGGPDIRASEAPDVIAHSTFWKECIQAGTPLHWLVTLREEKKSDKLDILCPLFEKLATHVKSCVEKKERFCVIGGDHSAAIGTWSGASVGLEKALGLIWIDAHKDAHTFETSPSGNIHGMPVASLLGHGHPRLTQILTHHPKLLSENICLIGVRSYEEGEHKLLQDLNVKIYEMDEVQHRGISTILLEARDHVTKHTTAYGITCDLDAIDPKDIPGVSTPEPNGLNAAELLEAFSHLYPDPRQIGFEIMEFNPSQDKNHKTEQFIVDLLKLIATA